MKKIAIIGAGGINSWAIKHLRDIINIYYEEEENRDNAIYVKIFDKDEIEEKNLLRVNQNFDIEDLMLEKAEVLGKRYNFDYENCFITTENISKLDMFDDIIIGVDNHKTRKLVYEYCFEKNKFFIDMRAQGRQIAYYIKDPSKDMEYYNKKFFSNPDIMDRKGSCQYTHDVENDNIQNGNKMIAHMVIVGPFCEILKGNTVDKYEFKMVF